MEHNIRLDETARPFFLQLLRVKDLQLIRQESFMRKLAGSQTVQRVNYEIQNLRIDNEPSSVGFEDAVYPVLDDRLLAHVGVDVH